MIRYTYNNIYNIELIKMEKKEPETYKFRCPFELLCHFYTTSRPHTFIIFGTKGDLPPKLINLFKFFSFTLSPPVNPKSHLSPHMETQEWTETQTQ